MASHQPPAQKKTVARVMHEFRHGDLRRNDGEPVRDPKQAIAVALSEAGASDGVDPDTNRRNRARTRGKERAGLTPRALAEGHTTRAALYDEARRRNLPGRSRMSKDALLKALTA